MSYVFETSQGERITGCAEHFQNMSYRGTAEVIMALPAQLIYRARKGN